MKKTHINAILAIAVIALFATSCIKSSSQSTSDKLTGKWTINKTATDSNGNGKADANEWQPMQYVVSGFPISINATLNFMKGGTGKVNISAPPLFSDSSTFNWTLANKDTYIVMSGDTSSVTSGLTNGSAHIDSLSTNHLILKDTAGGMTTWLSATK